MQRARGTRVLLVACAAALAGVAVARRSCNTQQFGQQQGREVHIREQRMSPSMADWKIRIPPVCPKIVGVSATACDADGAPTIHLSSERGGVVRRSGGLKTGAYVYITVFCDPDTISPHLLDLLTTPSPEIINLPQSRLPVQGLPQQGITPQALPLPGLPSAGLPGHPSYVMSPQYISPQSWLQSSVSAGSSDQSDGLYPVSPAFWTHQNLQSNNLLLPPSLLLNYLQNSNYLNPPLRHPDDLEKKGNGTVIIEPPAPAEKVKAALELQEGTPAPEPPSPAPAVDPQAQQPNLQPLQPAPEPPQIQLSPHEKHQKESLLKRIEHWWAEHVRAWTSRRQARRMLRQGNHVVDPDRLVGWARRHNVDLSQSRANARARAHRARAHTRSSSETDDDYNYNIYSQNNNIDDDY